jgi:hypothetical protein
VEVEESPPELEALPPDEVCPEPVPEVDPELPWLELELDVPEPELIWFDPELGPPDPDCWVEPPAGEEPPPLGLVPDGGEEGLLEPDPWSVGRVGRRKVPCRGDASVGPTGAAPVDAGLEPDRPVAIRRVDVLVRLRAAERTPAPASACLVTGPASAATLPGSAGRPPAPGLPAEASTRALDPGALCAAGGRAFAPARPGLPGKEPSPAPTPAPAAPTAASAMSPAAGAPSAAAAFPRAPNRAATGVAGAGTA